MRASIPALCVLCVFVIRFLTERHSGARRKVSAALLAVLLMIGAVTPLGRVPPGIYKFAKRAQFSLPPIRSARCFTPTRTRTTSSAATCASTGSIVTLRDKGDTLGRCPKPYPKPEVSGLSHLLYRFAMKGFFQTRNVRLCNIHRITLLR